MIFELFSKKSLIRNLSVTFWDFITCTDHKYCMECDSQYEKTEFLMKHCNEKHSMKIKCNECPFQGFDWEVKQHRCHGNSSALPGPNIRLICSFFV